ncbi:hypothetical protein HAX54_049632 [Datura stramonium]|uniref:Uncharacterized protein n=1 Tax=Datura stramonium TaxID=4076 RepID=A0ABS8SV58_DATST|nr:hypothetical protein [Datura stramonium]
MFLRLSRNKFDGNIPPQICQLKNLIILDLSSNALSGTIPKCVEKFLTMAGVEELPSLVYGPYEDYRKDVMVMLKERGYDGLVFFAVIDLSDNRLSGEIPAEITTLVRLQLLNNLTGAIPCEISNLKSLEFLDVSRNDLSSFLPSNMVELHLLAFANFSFNSLTGKIPFRNQFSTFENSSNIGNPELCGIPLSKSCSGHFLEDNTHCNTPKKQDVQAIQQEENHWLDESSFYISMGVGFITSFGVFWATLLLKTSWRHAYMRRKDFSFNGKSKNHKPRSTSLPTAAHPLIASAEENLQRLKSSEGTSTSSHSIICQRLDGLRKLYECIDDFIRFPLSEQVLSNEKHAKSLEQVSNGSVKVLDTCNIIKDAFSQMKESVQLLESSLRRKRGGESSLSNEIDAYMSSNKKINKVICRYFRDLKNTVKNDTIVIEDSDLASFIRLIEGVEDISLQCWNQLLFHFPSKDEIKDKWLVFGL